MRTSSIESDSTSGLVNAIDPVAHGKVQLGALVTGHYDLDHVNDALTAGRRDPTSMKPIVGP